MKQSLIYSLIELLTHFYLNSSFFVITITNFFFTFQFNISLQTKDKLYEKVLLV